MSRLFWTWEAMGALDALSDQDEQRLFELLELIESYPAMYPKRQRGRFAGLRYFLLGKKWLIYYRIRDDDKILVFAIVPAIARP